MHAVIGTTVCIRIASGQAVITGQIAHRLVLKFKSSMLLLYELQPGAYGHMATALEHQRRANPGPINKALQAPRSVGLQHCGSLNLPEPLVHALLCCCLCCIRCLCLCLLLIALQPSAYLAPVAHATYAHAAPARAYPLSTRISVTDVLLC